MNKTDGEVRSRNLEVFHQKVLGLSLSLMLTVSLSLLCHLLSLPAAGVLQTAMTITAEK